MTEHAIPHLIGGVCYCMCTGCVSQDEAGEHCTCVECDRVRCGFHL